MIELIFSGIITFIANAITMVTGIGLATVMVPTLLIIFPIGYVLFITALIHWVNNLAKVVLFYKKIDWRVTIVFGIPSVVGSLLGSIFIVHMIANHPKRLMGFFLAVYALFLIINPTFKLKERLTTSLAGGLLSGFSAGFFGIRGAITGAFLVTYNLPKLIYIATIGMINFLVDTVRLSIYIWGGFYIYEKSSLLFDLVFYLTLSWIGIWCGIRLIGYINQRVFRTVICVVIFLSGIRLMIG